MGETINIRRAQEDDINKMMLLIQELAHFEKEPLAVTVSENEFRDAGFGLHPVWWSFVAECQQSHQLVGMALFYIRYSTWKGKLLYLEDIIINHAFRGQGIGQLLIDRLEEEARALKLKGMCWQVLEWNEQAINFYKKDANTQFSNEWINVQKLLPY